MKKVSISFLFLLVICLIFWRVFANQENDLSRNQKSYKGIVVYPSDLISLGTDYWVDLLKKADLNLLGIHTDTKFETLPKLKAYLTSQEGQQLLSQCKEANIDIEFELHVLQDILPRELYNRYPEYFRMDKKGKRQQKYNMCFHSEGAYQEIAKQLREVCQWLKPTTHRYFFWTDDVEHAFCQCEKCRQYSQSELALMYENRLLEIIRSIDPLASVAHLAYLTTSLEAPQKIKPKEGIFLEYAPIARDYSKPLAQKHINNIKDNLKVFPAETAHILEYWLDVSMYSHWKRDNLQEIPWKKEYCNRDVKQYTELGIRSVTCFGAWLNKAYQDKYGKEKTEGVVFEYGEVLKRHVQTPNN